MTAGRASSDFRLHVATAVSFDGLAAAHAIGSVVVGILGVLVGVLVGRLVA